MIRYFQGRQRTFTVLETTGDIVTSDRKLWLFQDVAFAADLNESGSTSGKVL